MRRRLGGSQFRLVRGVVVVAVLALGMLGLAPGAAQAAPPGNDEFANATVVDPSSLPFGDAVDNTQATLESGEPQYCSGAPRTVWYSITPPRATPSGASPPSVATPAACRRGDGSHSTASA